MPVYINGEVCPFILMVMFTCSGGLWPPPQSIDILPQISLLLRVFSHGNHSSCCVYSPTDFTEFTELLAACILPQISQNSQNFLLRLFSHRFHRSTQIVWVPSRGCTCLKCTNRARSTPTEQNRYSPTESTELTELLAERILPQISQIYTDG